MGLLRHESRHVDRGPGECRPYLSTKEQIGKAVYLLRTARSMLKEVQQIAATFELEATVRQAVLVMYHRDKLTMNQIAMDLKDYDIFKSKRQIVNILQQQCNPLISNR